MRMTSEQQAHRDKMLGFLTWCILLGVNQGSGDKFVKIVEYGDREFGSDYLYPCDNELFEYWRTVVALTGESPKGLPQHLEKKYGCSEQSTDSATEDQPVVGTKTGS